MIWSSPEAFFHMGGYGLFVWGSYGLTAALMLVEPVLAARRYAAARRAARNNVVESMT